MNGLSLPLHAVEIAVCTGLVGAKRAVRFGTGPILVSPAMYDLIRAASPDELQTLLEAIRVQQLPPLPTLGELAAAPMFALPPHALSEPGDFNYAAAMIDRMVFSRGW